MLEDFMDKRVAIWIKVERPDAETCVFTGYIVEEMETHFKFRDKFDKLLMFNKNALIQIKEDRQQ